MSINKVETITNSEFKNSNGFIVYNDETKSAIIVNTAFGSLEQMQQFVTSKGLEVCAIIIMSAHFENFVRLNEYCAAFPNVEIYMTIDDIPALFNPEEFLLWNKKLLRQLLFCFNGSQKKLLIQQLFSFD
jgi:glyoxylase-like metal-dependent hydrolase (beta-lactamase superfamily II)